MSERKSPAVLDCIEELFLDDMLGMALCPSCQQVLPEEKGEIECQCGWKASMYFCNPDTMKVRGATASEIVDMFDDEILVVDK